MYKSPYEEIAQLFEEWFKENNWLIIDVDLEIGFISSTDFSIDFYKPYEMGLQSHSNNTSWIIELWGQDEFVKEYQVSNPNLFQELEGRINGICESWHKSRYRVGAEKRLPDVPHGSGTYEAKPVSGNGA